MDGVPYPIRGVKIVQAGNTLLAVCLSLAVTKIVNIAGGSKLFKRENFSHPTNSEYVHHFALANDRS